MVPGRIARRRLRLGYSPAVSKQRRLVSAEVLSVGSELTVGETRDTNSGELARSLTELGLRVERIQAVPDVLEAVTDAFAAALGRSDVVVSTGGLGPTPDDLTREAIAAVAGETPVVDSDLEAWLRGLWTPRGMPMPDLNLKQAWLIPSAIALPNGNGTAPGWWVDRADGRVVIALPGPPREMRPIWHDVAVPRLQQRGAGVLGASETLRLQGIGESVVAERIGEELLRATNPQVATYARSDAVDVRISATGEDAAAVVAATTARIREDLGEHVWATGATTWPEAIGAELEERGWTIASVEIGTGGALATLLADQPWLRRGEIVQRSVRVASAADPAIGPALEALVREVMDSGAADVGIGVTAKPQGGDTAVSVTIVRPGSVHHERRIVFLDGPQGRSRAGLAAAAVLLGDLRQAHLDQKT